MIYIGCSGFQYDDWIGKFYPEGLDKKYFFHYYSRFFNTTEINSSFYSFPQRETVISWIRKARADEDFIFSFKYPQEVTHSQNPFEGKSIDIANEFQRDVLEPFRKEGKLGAALIQLSPFLNPEKDQTIIKRINDFLGSINVKDYRNSMEIRNRGFLVPGILESFLKILYDHNVALVSIDSPLFNPFYYPTADFSYVRFHGRNYDIWFKHDVNDGRLNRYDYLYSIEELLPWVDLVKRMNGDVFLYFNNHAYAKAAINALEFSRLLGINVDKKGYNQRDLSSFDLEME